MKYVCSKKYKILCREDCSHVQNIKEKNRVWFDTISEGIEYGCRPCKHCLRAKIAISNIDWDADASVCLPSTLFIDINKNTYSLLDDINGYADNLTDCLSDKYGYCLNGYAVDIVEVEDEVNE